MCIIFIITHQHPDFPIIIAANRDEYYSRPTASAHFWTDRPILAGKDLEAGGTWLGVTLDGRFAAVTNYRQPEPVTKGKSRGLLVTDFLDSHFNPAAYSELLANTSHEYAGYNCVFGNLSTETGNIQYFSNRSENPLPLGKGIFGLSNALLDTPWPKVINGKTQINTLLQTTFDADDWMMMLKNNQQIEDDKLPDTGLAIESERMLSPIFIQGDDYGTRCSTVITVTKTGILNFFERTYFQDNIYTQDRHFSFEINT